MDNGDKKAAYNLGMCYYNGTGVKKDYKQAATLLGEAAGAGLYSYKITEMNIVEDEVVREPPKTVEVVRREDERTVAVKYNDEGKLKSKLFRVMLGRSGSLESNILRKAILRKLYYG